MARDVVDAEHWQLKVSFDTSSSRSRFDKPLRQVRTVSADSSLDAFLNQIFGFVSIMQDTSQGAAGVGFRLNLPRSMQISYLLLILVMLDQVRKCVCDVILICGSRRTWRVACGKQMCKVEVKPKCIYCRSLYSSNYNQSPMSMNLSSQIFLKRLTASSLCCDDLFLLDVFQLDFSLSKLIHRPSCPPKQMKKVHTN
jgi:hypothetical protein